MRPWLEGNLAGVDVKAELPAVRDVLFAAAHRGEDVSALVRGVADADPIAVAELCVGPRAVAHRSTVAASLGVLDALEKTVSPSGLYSRLADLAPELADRILASAIARHPAAPWLIRMSVRLDPVPGRSHLLSVHGGAWFSAVCAMYAREGVVEGLLALCEQGEVEPVAALYRAGRDWTQAAVTVLLADPEAPVVPWLAGLHGPDLAPLLEPLVPRVEGIARQRLQAALSHVS